MSKTISIPVLLALVVTLSGCTAASVVGTTVGVGVGVGTGAVRAGVGVTSAVIDLAIPDGEDREDCDEDDDDRRDRDDEDACEGDE